MKLLIFTQKVDENDPILGFFHNWILEFSKYFEEVLVVCLEKGEFHLPKNVRVFSLGKEDEVSKIKYIFNFFHYIRKLEYDAVFVHMSPEYICLGGWYWKLKHKKIMLWYVHRQVNMKLRIATALADIIYTSSKESFRIRSKKVRYVGHGIEPQKFSNTGEARYQPLKILHLGRITKIKQIEIIIQALKKLGEGELLIVGEASTSKDLQYKKELEKLIEDLGLNERVVWKGSMPNTEAFELASVSINAAPDGGMDKAVLESLAAKRAAFTLNKSFKEVFGRYQDLFMYKDSDDLAKKIKSFLEKENKDEIVCSLTERVVVQYDISKLVENISNEHFFVVQRFKKDDQNLGLRSNYPLDEGSLVIDLGGYKGEWSQKIWDKYKCNIYIFEPVKKFYEEICERFKNNEKIKVFNFGLSDKDQQIQASFSADATSAYGRKKNIEISLKDVAEIFEDLKIKKVDLIKLNVEGEEFKILPRMIESGIIECCQDIQVQFHNFYPGAEILREQIRHNLARTHYLTYDYPFVFENWRKNA